MTSLTPRHYPSAMTPLTPLLWRHLPLVTTPLVREPAGIRRYAGRGTQSTLGTRAPRTFEPPTGRTGKYVWHCFHYDITNPSTMTSLPFPLWRRYPFHYDVATLSTMTSLPFHYDVTTSSTMTSLPFSLWRRYHFHYDVATISTMTSLPFPLWRRYPFHYDVATLSTMTSLPLPLWRHYPFHYDVTTLSTMTSLPFPLWRHYPFHYDVATLSTMTSLPFPLWRHATNYDVSYFVLILPAGFLYQRRGGRGQERRERTGEDRRGGRGQERTGEDRRGQERTGEDRRGDKRRERRGDFIPLISTPLLRIGWTTQVTSTSEYCTSWRRLLLLRFLVFLVMMMSQIPLISTHAVTPTLLLRHLYPIMTLLWHHSSPTITSLLPYYDVTYPATMTSLTHLLWRH